MASIPRRFLQLSRRCPSRISSIYISPKYTPQWQRSLTTTPSRRADEPPKDSTPQSETADQLSKLLQDLKAIDPDLIDDAIRKGKEGISWAEENPEDDAEEDFELQEEDTRRVGFWGEGEESLGKDEDYYGDDLTSLGHGELEQHRELREYARLIAWELPLLNQLAKPFVPPTSATPFRFRYTSYLGESHPATNKVVVEFAPTDLPLTPLAVSKLIKLAGPRYNPSSQIIKISCEKFDTQAQNKRFLGETIEKLLKEAKDERDTFEDVPFDFRHHREKKRHVFPKEWILTEERKAQLAQRRKNVAEIDDRRTNNGNLVDGKVIVETSLPVGRAEPEMAMVGGPRGRALQ